MKDALEQTNLVKSNPTREKERLRSSSLYRNFIIGMVE